MLSSIFAEMIKFICILKIILWQNTKLFFFLDSLGLWLLELLKTFWLLVLLWYVLHFHIHIISKTMNQRFWILEWEFLDILASWYATLWKLPLGILDVACHQPRMTACFLLHFCLFGNNNRRGKTCNLWVLNTSVLWFGVLAKLSHSHAIISLLFCCSFYKIWISSSF